MWRRAGEREPRRAWGWRDTGDARRERREGGKRDLQEGGKWERNLKESVC